jgi:hypothetical protein
MIAGGPMASGPGPAAAGTAWQPALRGTLAEYRSPSQDGSLPVQSSAVTVASQVQLEGPRPGRLPSESGPGGGRAGGLPVPVAGGMQA